MLSLLPPRSWWRVSGMKLAGDNSATKEERSSKKKKGRPKRCSPDLPWLLFLDKGLTFAYTMVSPCIFCKFVWHQRMWTRWRTLETSMLVCCRLTPRSKCGYERHRLNVSPGRQRVNAVVSSTTLLPPSTWYRTRNLELGRPTRYQSSYRSRLTSLSQIGLVKDARCIPMLRAE